MPRQPARSSRAHPIDAVHGGLTRQQSVLAGLHHLRSKDLTHVLIHDAVRPFFDHTLLDRIASRPLGWRAGSSPGYARQPIR